VDREGIVESVSIKANDSIQSPDSTRVPLNIYLFFKRGAVADRPRDFTDVTARNILSSGLSEYFDGAGDNTQTRGQLLNDGTVAARITTLGIARHPAQLYESIACVFLFLFLWWLWSKKKENTPAGRLLGIFLIWCFGLRFLFEFLKEVQEPFEEGMALNMGQILSIPCVIAGIVILVLSYREKNTDINELKK
jgi:prolipoprotein diacylglyceryltransferase